MQVNISRLHNIMEQISDDISSKEDQIKEILKAFPYDGYIEFPILEATSDTDLLNFQKNLHKKNCEVKNLFSQIEDLLKYRKYIKEMLSHFNNEKGILDRLLHVSILQKEKNIYSSWKNSVQRVASSEFDEIKKVDYYKSSFTNDNKVYSLKLKLFNQSDVEEISKKLETIDKQIQDLNNQIAFINQTTICEISSFEEYISDK